MENETYTLDTTDPTEIHATLLVGFNGQVEQDFVDELADDLLDDAWLQGITVSPATREALIILLEGMR